MDRGGRYEEGGGARAIARVLRAAAADAHVEGGAEVRRLRGASRLLADARRYLVAGSPPARRSLSIRRGLRRDGNDGRNDDRNDDGDDDRNDDVELLGTVRGGVRGATPGDTVSLLDEICLAVSVCYAAGPEPDGGGNQAAGSDFRTSGPSTAATTGIDDAEHLVEFLGDCPDPRLVTRVVSLARGLVECPNVERGFARASALLRAGVVDVAAGLLRRRRARRPRGKTRRRGRRRRTGGW